MHQCYFLSTFCQQVIVLLGCFSGSRPFPGFTPLNFSINSRYGRVGIQWHFSGIWTPGNCRRLRRITQERQFAAGQEIFREGDPGDGVYVVRDGSVEIAHLTDWREHRVFSRLGPGEIFGEMAVIEHLPRSATATAVEGRAGLFHSARRDARRCIERSPGLAFNVLQQISHRLREFNQLHLREIVQAERLAVVGNFARSIVHDLKNPLSIIGLSTETLDVPGITPGETRAIARLHPPAGRAHQAT